MSFNLVLIAILFHISTFNCSTLQLSPNNSFTDSAIINTLKNVFINPDINAWQIIPRNQIGFHLSLTLSNPYNFHHTNQTTITIQFQTINTSNTNPLLISIAPSNTTYISTILPSYHKITYPHCNNTQPLATGNIEQLLSINNTQLRITKATNNVYTENDIQPQTDKPITNHSLIMMHSQSLFTITPPITHYSSIHIVHTNTYPIIHNQPRL